MTTLLVSSSGLGYFVGRFAILFFLATSSVLPTLWGSFVFDDGEAILKNPLVTQPDKEGLIRLFKHDFWGVEITHPHSHKSYRPLTTLTYRWEYTLWGSNPLPFHLHNILLHGLNSCFVYLFLQKCLKKISGFESRERYLERIAFLSSVLFAVHPVHVEPVGGLVGRADLLSSLVFLMGFIIIPNHHSLSFLFISGFAIFGSLFKENAIVLSIIFVSLDFLVESRLHLSKKKLFQYSGTVLITGSFVLWRLWFQGGSPVFQAYDNPPMFANDTLTKLYSVTYVWTLNGFTLVNPIWLCYDWSMGCVKLVESFLDPRAVFTILFGAIILIILAIAIRRRNKVILVAVLISGLTFLPSSNVFLTVGFVLAERNLYLPSIGYCLFVAYCFIQKNHWNLLLYIITIFYLRSLQRSFHWIDQATLFKTGLQVCPDNAKIHYNLGTTYGEIGEISTAERSYKQALKLRPNYYQAMNNLGNLIRANNATEAEYWLREAVKLKTDFAAAWMNLGIVLSKKNQTEAFICYTNALRHRKVYPDCEYNLGNLFLDMGDDESAFSSWRNATILRPSHSQAWINVIILLEQQNKLQEAKQTGIEALKVLQNSDTVHFILGNILGKLSEYEEAENHFIKAINICREENNKKLPAKYFANLGVLYHRWGQKQAAAEAYKNALAIDPALDSAKKNLDSLKM